MADLIPDTGARGENVDENPDDPQQVGQGHAAAPGGGDTSPLDDRIVTHGQETYPGPRADGDSARPGPPAEAQQSDPAVNNAAQVEAGDTDPGSTADADETGMAGVNDRPGKDQAHPWNG